MGGRLKGADRDCRLEAARDCRSEAARGCRSATGAAAVRRDGQPPPGAGPLADPVPVDRDLPDAAVMVPRCPGLVARRYEAAGRAPESAAAGAEPEFAVQPQAEPPAWWRQEPRAAAKKLPGVPRERASAEMAVRRRESERPARQELGSAVRQASLRQAPQGRRQEQEEEQPRPGVGQASCERLWLPLL